MWARCGCAFIFELGGRSASILELGAHPSHLSCSQLGFLPSSAVHSSSRPPASIFGQGLEFEFLRIKLTERTRATDRGSGGLGLHVWILPNTRQEADGRFERKVCQGILNGLLDSQLGLSNKSHWHRGSWNFLPLPTHTYTPTYTAHTPHPQPHPQPPPQLNGRGSVSGSCPEGPSGKLPQPLATPKTTTSRKCRSVRPVRQGGY